MVEEVGNATLITLHSELKRGKGTVPTFLGDLAESGPLCSRGPLLCQILLLGAKGIATRSKDATRGSWHRY